MIITSKLRSFISVYLEIDDGDTCIPSSGSDYSNSKKGFLAEKIGCSESTISKWITDPKPKNDYILRQISFPNWKKLREVLVSYWHDNEEKINDYVQKSDYNDRLLTFRSLPWEIKPSPANVDYYQRIMREISGDPNLYASDQLESAPVLSFVNETQAIRGNDEASNKYVEPASKVIIEAIEEAKKYDSKISDEEYLINKLIMLKVLEILPSEVMEEASKSKEILFKEKDLILSHLIEMSSITRERIGFDINFLKQRYNNKIEEILSEKNHENEAAGGDDYTYISSDRSFSVKIGEGSIFIKTDRENPYEILLSEVEDRINKEIDFFNSFKSDYNQPTFSKQIETCDPGNYDYTKNLKDDDLYLFANIMYCKFLKIDDLLPSNFSLAGKQGLYAASKLWIPLRHKLSQYIFETKSVRDLLKEREQKSFNKLKDEVEEKRMSLSDNCKKLANHFTEIGSIITSTSFDGLKNLLVEIENFGLQKKILISDIMTRFDILCKRLEKYSFTKKSKHKTEMISFKEYIYENIRSVCLNNNKPSSGTINIYKPKMIILENIIKNSPQRKYKKSELLALIKGIKEEDPHFSKDHEEVVNVPVDGSVANS